LLLPLLQCWKETFERLFVANKVIGNKLNMAAVAKVEERLKLRQHLFICLRARNAPVELDDVAKFTIERTTAGKLDANIPVMLHLEQIKAWNRSLRYVSAEFLGFEQPCCGPARPCLDELLDGVFGLPQHAEIGIAIDMGA